MKTSMKCVQCDISFTYNDSFNKHRKRLYCSRKCADTGQRFSENQHNDSLKRRLISGSKANETTGCIEWQKCINTAGYGTLLVSKPVRRMIGVHRVSWIIHYGEIPDGFFVCHTCDNSLCHNIEHLFLGTPKYNSEDMVKKGRWKGRSPIVINKRISSENGRRR